jgi:UDP-glucose 4-epimerase
MAERPFGRRWIVVGGAGFIGAHFVDRLLAHPDVERVTVYDNFSSGRAWHLDPHRGDPRLTIRTADVADTDALCDAMRGHDVVVHLASNSDIASAMLDPDVDFRQGTALTRSVVEAMRRTETPRILYASGSGVYGDLGETEAAEDHGPLIPVSTYAASKIAGEALVSSYAFMFDLSGCAFRFGNVVGPRQTHGVGFDFVRKLLADSGHLEILGDGSQSKSYIHVDDVLDAVFLAHRRTDDRFRAYNVATGDYITVREIADVALECLGLSRDTTEYRFTGGPRGWNGDVPIVRLDTERIRALGWRCRRGSREAVQAAMLDLVEDERAGRL